MLRHLSKFPAVLALCTATVAARADASPDARVAVLNSKQVIEILDATVDWYRLLATQQQAATQPSDLLILFANRQTAGEIVSLAFDIARANAELLSSEENSVPAGAPASSTDTLAAENAEVGAQIDSLKQDLKGGGQQLAMLRAKQNLLDTMSAYVEQSDPKGADANALKAQIDAIAAAVPQWGASPATVSTSTSAAAGTTPAAAATGTIAATGTVAATGTITALGGTGAPALALPRSTAGSAGIWELGTTAFAFKAKLKVIDFIDRETAKLAHLFVADSAAPKSQLEAYTARSQTLLDAARKADADAQRTIRNQFDTLAWLFKQTSGVLLPLDQAQVLLRQYQRNLTNWHASTEIEYHEALEALGIRVAILLAILFVVWVLADIWKRTVQRFVHETQRRYQLLLIRRIVMWVTMVVIAGLSFATEISSFATFAGLLTAGLAVAMQSVLVSVVGYFFLIGKYGIRVGDRIQIGTVVGEVVDIGLVRMHLRELNTSGPLGPTGRVVAFANLIVFQASGGLFKQIPGINLSWHEITLTLPAVSDYGNLKTQLLQRVSAILSKYLEEITSQTLDFERSTAGTRADEPRTAESMPQVQMHLADGRMMALIRYPVHGTHAAQIDEEVAESVLAVIGLVTREPPH